MKNFDIKRVLELTVAIVIAIVVAKVLDKMNAFQREPQSGAIGNGLIEPQLNVSYGNCNRKAGLKSVTIGAGTPYESTGFIKCDESVISYNACIGNTRTIFVAKPGQTLANQAYLNCSRRNRSRF